MALRDVCSRRGCHGHLLQTGLDSVSDNHYRTLYQGDVRGTMRVEEHTAQLATERGREIQREFQEGLVHVLSCSTTFELGVDLGDLNTVFLRNVPPEPFNYAQRIGRAGRRAGTPGFAITYCRRGAHDLYHFNNPTRILGGRTSPPSISLSNERIAERHLVAVAPAAFFRKYPDRFKHVSSLIGEWSEPTTISAVAAFLGETRSDLERCLSTIFSGPMRIRLGIDDGSWVEAVSGPASRLNLAVIEVVSDFKRADDTEISARTAGDYRQAQWAQRRKRTIAGEDVLSFLSRRAVIPKYGFPVDVVELDTQGAGVQQAYQVSLARDRAIAIGEFAPTATLIAAKREWQSHGLKRVPEKEWERRQYKVCHRHNLMVTWNEGEVVPDLPCGDAAVARKYVIPIFGFVTSTKPPKVPSRRPERLFTTRPYFVAPEGPDRGEMKIGGKAAPLATVRKAVPGRMAVLSEGRRAGQFYVCGACGAGFVEVPRGAHTTSWGGSCGGKLERVSLGHEFVTDVVQVEFHHAPRDPAQVDPQALALGIAAALVDGLAEVTGTPPSDLNVTIGRQGSAGLPTIVLYDDVPGGAGLVASIESPTRFRSVLEAAYRRVDGGCECGEDTSCYGCLRSYRNQYAHTMIKRGPVKNYIEAALSEWQE